MRAQSASMIVVFVLALLIGSLVMLFGYRSVRRILGQAETATLLTFKEDLESVTTTLSYGSVKKANLNLPSGYTAICFADLDYLGSNLSPELRFNVKFHVINDSVQDAQANVFLFPDGSQSFLVGPLIVEGGFACANASAGRVTVGFEGMGNRTKVTVR
ncbi:hypothetical protein J4439_04125 [Candidatus Woesearchaeota archaeon]|nr:hypothetical protein [Candidatus Woesearchaeota archaeon]